MQLPLSAVSLSDSLCSALCVCVFTCSGSITSMCVWQHVVFVGTATGALLRYEIELYEEEDPVTPSLAGGFSSTTAAASSVAAASSTAVPALVSSSSALRPGFSPPNHFVLLRSGLVQAFDAKRFHSPRGKVCAISTIVVCPPLGCLFVLSEGVLCLYDFETLGYQHAIKPPKEKEPVDRFALWPNHQTQTATASPSFGKSFSLLSLALCVGKRVYIMVRSMDSTAATHTSQSQVHQWETKQELVIPEPANCVCWINSILLLVGFKREYTIINTVTGDVIDLCAVDAAGETVLHQLGNERSLINAGNKSLMHYCEGDQHVLVDAQRYHQTPLALGSTALFAFAMDAEHVHVYLKPQPGSLSWKTVQNIAVKDASCLWSDGGALALLSKGAQIYFLQPIHATDKSRDMMLMFSIKSQYLAPNPNAPVALWTREEASKAVAAHVQAVLNGRTHPFALMITGFTELFAKHTQALLVAAAPPTSYSAIVAASLSATPSSSPLTAAASSRSGTAAASAAVPVLSPDQRGELVRLVGEFQSTVETCMRVMWADCCGTPRVTRPAAPQSSPAESPSLLRRSVSQSESLAPAPEAPPPNFLPECSALFDDALFKSIYPSLFPVYAAFCAADDASFNEACALYIEQHATMETFGSSILRKSPWLSKRQNKAAEAGPSKRPSVSAKQAAAHPLPADSADPLDAASTASAPSTPPLKPLGQSLVHPLSPSSNPLLAMAVERTGPVPLVVEETAEEQAQEEAEAGDKDAAATAASATAADAQAPGADAAAAASAATSVPVSWPSTPSITSALVLTTLLLDSFAPSISLIRGLPSLFSPGAKLRLLGRLHQQLLLDSQKIYDPAPIGAKPFTMSADDLVPILCFVLVQAKLARPFTEAEILMDFLGDEAALGADGYMVTSVQIALQQITHRDSRSASVSGPSPGGRERAASRAQGDSLLSSLTQSHSSFLGSPPVSASKSLTTPSGNVSPSALAPDGTSPVLSPLKSNHITIRDYFGSIDSPLDGSSSAASAATLPQPSAPRFTPRISSHFARRSDGGSLVGSPTAVVGSEGAFFNPALSAGSARTTLTRSESGVLSSASSPAPHAGIGHAILAGHGGPSSAASVAAAIAAASSSYSQQQQVAPSALYPASSPSSVAAHSLHLDSPSTPSPPPGEWRLDPDTGRNVMVCELKPIGAGSGGGGSASSSHNAAGASSGGSAGVMSGGMSVRTTSSPAALASSASFSGGAFGSPAKHRASLPAGSLGALSSSGAAAATGNRSTILSQSSHRLLAATLTAQAGGQAQRS